jgi:toxin ParE1/3/4
VIIKPAAQLDINAQIDYFAERDPRLAERFADAVSETGRLLADMPGDGFAPKFRNPELAGVRRWYVRGFKKHLLFYRQIPEGIEIVRVDHGARDLKTLFGE